jgi:hypothetical protein
MQEIYQGKGEGENHFFLVKQYILLVVLLELKNE